MIVIRMGEPLLCSALKTLMRHQPFLKSTLPQAATSGFDGNVLKENYDSDCTIHYNGLQGSSKIMLMTPRYMIMAVSYKRAAAGHILPFCRSRLRGLYRHHLSPSSSLPYFPPPCSSLKAFFAQVNDPSQHYHLPLLLNSFSFTTYRGS